MYFLTNHEAMSKKKKDFIKLEYFLESLYTKIVKNLLLPKKRYSGHQHFTLHWARLLIRSVLNILYV